MTIKLPYSPDFEKNAKRAPGASSPNACAICARATPNPLGFVRMFVDSTGGYAVATHDEWPTLRGDMGFRPIGSDCLRRHPALKPFVYPFATSFPANREASAPITASQYASLARKAASDLTVPVPGGAKFLTVLANGVSVLQPGRPTTGLAPKVVLYCDLTAKATASQDALTRALLANVKEHAFCIACGIEPPIGMLGTQAYIKRCSECSAAFDAKRNANIEAKLRRQYEAIRDSKH